MEFNDTQIAIGENLVKSLKEKDDMKFMETTPQKAKEGLKNGDFAMVITVPENFSANAATVLDENPKKLNIHYETNPGINFLGSKVSSTVADNITAAVNKEVTRKYSEAIISAMNNMEKGLSSAADGSKKLVKGTDKLVVGYDKLSGNTGKLTSGVTKLQDGSRKLKKGVNNYTAGVSKSYSGVKKLEKGSKNLKSGASNLQSGVTNYTNGVRKSYEGAKNLKIGSDNLTEGISSLNKGHCNAPTADSISQLQVGILAMQSSITEFGNTDPSDTATIKQLQQKLKSQSAALTGAHNALGGMSAALSNVKSNAGKLEMGASNLQNGSATLVKNMAKLTAMNDVLNSGADNLVSGTDSMVLGSDNLFGGVSKLSAMSPTLKQGTNNLVSGSRNMASGTNKLAGGVKSMGIGVSNLSDGAGVLNKKLTDGASEAEDKVGKTSSKTVDQMSEPVKGKTSEAVNVKNMGNSMAAFLATVGIWLGAMVFCLMYPIHGESGEPKKKGLVAWGDNASIFIPLSALWGAAIVPLMKLCLNIEPQSWFLTILVGAIAGITFVSITYFFNIAIGGPAMAVILLLLSMQLAGGGGIFPMAMTSRFYQVLHIFMPFSYSTQAFRSTLTNGNSIVIPCLVLICIAVVMNVLSILVQRKQYQKGQRAIV